MSFGATIGAGLGLAADKYATQLFSNRSKDGWAPSSFTEAMRPYQRGIQWRVADARKAGVHPLFALGANVGGGALGGTVTRPVDPGLTFDASGLGRAGAGRRSALDARAASAGIRRTEAESALLAAQAAKAIQEMNYTRAARDAIAPAGTPKPRKRPFITTPGGKRWIPPAGDTVDVWERHIGELADWLVGPEALMKGKPLVPEPGFADDTRRMIQRFLEDRFK